jgi:hypothetical protein
MIAKHPRIIETKVNDSSVEFTFVTEGQDDSRPSTFRINLNSQGFHVSGAWGMKDKDWNSIQRNPIPSKTALNTLDIHLVPEE